MTREARAGLRTGVFGLWALALAGLAPRADGAVRDEWAERGVLSVRGENWRAEFRAAKGAVAVSFGRETVRIAPFDARRARPRNTVACRVVESDGQKTVVKASFARGAGAIRAAFTLKADGTVEVRPEEGMEGVYIQGKIRYGVLPGIFLEDVIYDPREHPGLREVHVPSENLIMGFLEGGNGILACTWPEGGQKVRLLLEENGRDDRLVSGVEIALDGRSAYLTVLSAPAIWRREELVPTYLEKDVELEWKRPFPAKWKTELLENDVKTAYLFGKKRRSRWRPMLGFYVDPVWFDGDKAMMRLSKKIPPEDHAFIYPLEGHGQTPLDFVKRTPTAGIFAELRKREPYPKGPRNAPDVGFTHCWGTAIIKRTIYQYGIQKREGEFLDKHIDHCLDYVASIQTRNKQFHAFVKRMEPMLDAWIRKEGNDPHVLEFLEEMKDYLRMTEEGYLARVEREGRKTPAEHIAYANGLGERLKTLVREEGTELYPEYVHILRAFNTLSAASDEGIPAGFGTAVREWFQSAGYGCMDRPGAVPYAEAIRKAIWEKLRCRKWETTGI